MYLSIYKPIIPDFAAWKTRPVMKYSKPLRIMFYPQICILWFTYAQSIGVYEIFVHDYSLLVIVMVDKCIGILFKLVKWEMIQ